MQERIPAFATRYILECVEYLYMNNAKIPHHGKLGNTDESHDRCTVDPERRDCITVQHMQYVTSAVVENFCV
jgi:hypothetical protein